MTAQQLKNSILLMAVQGKLVPQDPNDEPASVLLERIHAEKERLIKEKKIKREKNPSVIFKGADNTPYEKIGDEVRSLADEVPFDIPDSWEWVRLGNISSYAETKQKVNATSADSSIWGLDLEDIEKGGRLLEYKTVGERKAVGDKTVFTKGDILYSKLRPYLLKILVAPDDGICTPEIVPFRVYGGIDPSYIVNYLKSPYVDNLINSITYGVKMPRVGTETMTSLLVPIPPLEEQRRIVEKIDEVASAVSAYDVAYQKNEALNSTFPEALKKSILQEAVQGKLVPQDPSDEPAEALLEHIRAEKQRLVKEGEIKKDKHESVIFRRDNSHYEKRGSEELCIDDDIPFDIPDNWIWTRLQNICSLIGDIDHNMPKSVPADEGVLFLSAKDLLDDGTINFTQNVKFISRADFERLSRKALPQKHDIIYSRIGAALGKARLVETDREFLVSYSCCVVRPLLVYPQYIRYYLESPQILLHSIKARQSIGVPDLGMGEIKKYLVALPPYNEQVRIVEQLEVLLGRCNFKM